MTDALQKCDLLIEAKWIVPIIPADTILENHALIVDQGMIIDLLPKDKARQKYLPETIVERNGSVLLPGLVNAHTHNPMTLMRGCADDLALMPWLQDHIWPIEGAVMGPDYVADGCTHAVAEMIRSGTTCCNENYFFPDVQATTYTRLGFRAVVGLPIIEFPTAWAKTAAEYFDKALEVHDQWRSDELISSAFAPHAPYTVSDASFERLAMLSGQLDLPIHCHIHESAQEIIDSIKEHGQRPLARLDRLGVVNEKLIAVHMTQLSPEEIKLCARAGVSVVHCPQSNMKLASGLAPVQLLRSAGVNVAIGTDGAASNNDLDMFDEMRTAALLAKVVANDATAMDAHSTLHAATMGGAKAMGLDAKIGSLEVGKCADLICVDLAQIETQPVFEPVSHLVYAANRSQVSDVWINGVQKMNQRELVAMDVPELLRKAESWRRRMDAARGSR